MLAVDPTHKLVLTSASALEVVCCMCSAGTQGILKFEGKIKLCVQSNAPELFFRMCNACLEGIWGL